MHFIPTYAVWRVGEQKYWNGTFTRAVAASLQTHHRHITAKTRESVGEDVKRTEQRWKTKEVPQGFFGWFGVLPESCSSSS